jgi:hypothetical protein
MIQLEKSSYSLMEQEYLFQYWKRNEPSIEKHQWTGTLFIGETEENGIVLTAPVQQYNNGVIETLDWVSIPLP